MYCNTRVHLELRLVRFVVCVCLQLSVSLLFDRSVCLSRPECLSVTGLRSPKAKFPADEGGPTEKQRGWCE